MTCVALEQIDWFEESQQTFDSTLEDQQRDFFAAAAARDDACYLALAEA